MQRFLGAAERARNHLRPRHHRGDQPRRRSFGRKIVREGDEILITAMEHHSNIVPWQMLCEEKRGARLRVAPINDAAN